MIMHHDDFIYAWNLCRTLAEVQKLTGMSYRACIMRANRYRKIGYDVKCFTAKREWARIHGKPLKTLTRMEKYS